MIHTIVAILAFGLLFVGLSSPVEAYEAVVVRVLDGDSFRVKHGGRTEEIRLYGIDCPEYKQAGWKEAKKMTQRLINKRRIEISPMDTDRYGRTVALVRAQKLLVNAELVAAGLAWTYHRYCHVQPLCRQFDKLEQDARSSRRGIWEKKSPVPPWVWKRKNH